MQYHFDKVTNYKKDGGGEGGHRAAAKINHFLTTCISAILNGNYTV